MQSFLSTHPIRRTCLLLAMLLLAMLLPARPGWAQDAADHYQVADGMPEDLNHDGKVTDADVQHARDCIFGLSTCTNTEDMNGDGLFDIVDLQAVILRKNTPDFSGIYLLYPDSPHSLTMRWQPAKDLQTPQDAIRYEIHVSQDPEFTPTEATLAREVTGGMEARVSGLTSGVEYHVLMVAVDEDGHRSRRRKYKTMVVPDHEIMTLQEGITLHVDTEIGLLNPTYVQPYSYVYPNAAEADVIPQVGDYLMITMGPVDIRPAWVGEVEMLDDGSVRIGARPAHPSEIFAYLEAPVQFDVADILQLAQHAPDASVGQSTDAEGKPVTTIRTGRTEITLYNMDQSGLSGLFDGEGFHPKWMVDIPGKYAEGRVTLEANLKPWFSGTFFVDTPLGEADLHVGGFWGDVWEGIKKVKKVKGLWNSFKDEAKDVAETTWNWVEDGWNWLTKELKDFFTDPTWDIGLKDIDTGVDTGFDYTIDYWPRVSFGKIDFNKEKHFTLARSTTVVMLGLIPVVVNHAFKLSLQAEFYAGMGVHAQVKGNMSYAVQVHGDCSAGHGCDTMKEENHEQSSSFKVGGRAFSYARVRVVPAYWVDIYSVSYYRIGLEGALSHLAELAVSAEFSGDDINGFKDALKHPNLNNTAVTLPQLTAFDTLLELNLYGDGGFLPDLTITAPMGAGSWLKGWKFMGEMRHPIMGPYTLLSLPKSSYLGVKETPESNEMQVAVVVRDGVNNKLDKGSVRWNVLGMDAENSEVDDLFAVFSGGFSSLDSWAGFGGFFANILSPFGHSFSSVDDLWIQDTTVVSRCEPWDAVASDRAGRWATEMAAAEAEIDTGVPVNEPLRNPFGRPVQPQPINAPELSLCTADITGPSDSDYLIFMGYSDSFVNGGLRNTVGGGAINFARLMTPLKQITIGQADTEAIDFDPTDLREGSITIRSDNPPTFYDFTNYNPGDFSVTLPPGNYTLSDLEAVGVENDEISSLKVPEGYLVILYADDNFSGERLVKTADDSDLSDDGFPNKTSSLRVLGTTTGFEEDYYRLAAIHSGRYLDVEGISTEDGANIHQWTEGGANQEWALTPTGDDGYYQIKARHSGSCMDGTGGGNIVQWACDTSAAHQQWRLLSSGDGSYLLYINKPDWNYRCAEVANDSEDNGATVRRAVCDGGANQEWMVFPELSYSDTVESTGLEAGNTHLLYLPQSKKCLQTEDILGSGDNEINITGKVCEPYSSLQDLLILPGEGEYHPLQLTANGTCVTVQNASESSGANVFQWECVEGDNQQWRVLPTQDGFVMLQAKHSGHCLAVSGTNIVQQSCKEIRGTLANNQKWAVVSTPAAGWVYPHGNWTGDPAPLDTGDYTSADLAARGIGDNSISSIKIDAMNGNGMLKLYAHGDFTPDDPLVLTDAVYNLGDLGWNDTVSSIRAVQRPDIVLTADNSFELYLNGELITDDSPGWGEATPVMDLPWQPGENVIAVKATNGAGAAGLLAEYVDHDNLSGDTRGRTNTSWKVTTTPPASPLWTTPYFDDSGWEDATDQGAYGVSPWYEKVNGMDESTPARWIWASTTSDNQTVYFRKTVERLGDTPSRLPDVIWFDDALPEEALGLGLHGGEVITMEPAPASGMSAFKTSNASGEQQVLGFRDTSEPMHVEAGETLTVMVHRIPDQSLPQEIMVEWDEQGGSNNHRAYWGENLIHYGTNGTDSRRYMGDISDRLQFGAWWRLEVPASQVGLEGKTVDGMNIRLYDGVIAWDAPGKLLASGTVKAERDVVPNVSSADWTTVDLKYQYHSMVVVATPVSLPGDKPAVVRLRDADAGTSFQMKLDVPVSSGSVSNIPVHYVVVEEGVYSSPKMEAKRIVSQGTNRKNSWSSSPMEPCNLSHSYSNPVVLGQVMTYNDPDWSVFWASNGTQTNPPTNSDCYVGKHVGEDPDTTRADETLGVIVLEQGTGTLNGIPFSAAPGGDSVRGVGNYPPYTYAHSVDQAGTAVLSAAAMDGSDGGWPVLYGSNPVSGGTLDIAINEDMLGDAERNHTTEQAASLVFEGRGTAQVQHGVVMASTYEWKTVELGRSYSSMVVVATPNYDSSDYPMVVRIRNASGSRFEMKLETVPGAVLAEFPVSYVVVEEGVYDSPKMEAKRIVSDGTNEDNNWSSSLMEPCDLGHSYANPVVLGQVMSANDSDWSVFWASNGTQTGPPTNAACYVGKHVGEDPDTTRVTETLGVIVLESGPGMLGDMPFIAGVGADTVEGVGGNGVPPYSYSVLEMDKFGVAVLSAAAMDGTHGGWPVLYGSNPVSPVNNGTLKLAIDEDTIGDAERAHTTEQVAYLILETEKIPEAYLDNVALNKDSFQSSTWGGYGPSRANDGNMNTMNHTQNEAAWWMVHLAGEYDVSRVVIWNRDDNYYFRLRDFNVYYVDSNGVLLDTYEHPGKAPQGPLTIDKFVPGVQRVSVKMDRGTSSYLHMKEVQVFGVPQ